ncbi:MAG: OmpA family protein [Bacteroidia bacterium]
MTPKRLLLIFICLLPLVSLAQTPVERRADRLFMNYAYADAIELYEYVLKKNPANTSVIRNLADASVKTGDYKRTEKYLKELIKAGQMKNEDYLHLALALQKNNKRDSALVFFNRYDELAGNDKRGERFRESAKSYKSFFDESDSYTFSGAPFNTEASDFSLCPYNQGFIMVSASGGKKYNPSRYPWDGQRWLDLWSVSKAGDPPAKKLGGDINSKYNEGPASWSPERNQLAFTRNSFYEGEVKRSADHVNKLAIFFAKPDGSKFTRIKPFVHNNPEYSNGHPAFADGGQKLYFASDRPGGFGGTDIWVCTRTDSSWSEPLNLGPAINTAGDEMFPFVYADSLLLFASDGWGGMGGMDVFSAEFSGDSLLPAFNPGSPLNSAFDDFAWLMLENGRTGYVSSNRPGGKGSDDIYIYTYSPVSTSILVSDHKTGKPLANAEVIIRSGERTIANGNTDANGKCRLLLRPCNDYEVEIKAANYPEHHFPAKSDCPVKPESELSFRIRQPGLKVTCFDKYLNTLIQGATVILTDKDEPNSKPREFTTNATGEITALLNPCHHYEVLARKDGLPEVSSVFTAPCKQAEPDREIRLGTGVPPRRGVQVSIVVKEEQNGDPINNARIRILDLKTGEFIDAMTDQTGTYQTVMNENSEILVSASAIGYFSTSKSKTELQIRKGSRKVEAELKLLQLREGGIIALEGIYYDLDKADVRPDAAKVLDYVVSVMQENPGMKIELGSHTDSQGSDSYNMDLSVKRAASAAGYIVSKGIDQSRISGKGYGETRLKNKCSNGVKCTDAEHQENRRTEIRILDMD